MAFYTLPQLYSYFQLRSAERDLMEMAYHDIEKLDMHGRRVLCLMSHDDGEGRVASFCERMFERYTPTEMIVVGSFEGDQVMASTTLDLSELRGERLRVEARKMPDGRGYQATVAEPAEGQVAVSDYDVLLRLSTLVPEENDRLKLTSSEIYEAYDLSVQGLPVARLATGHVRVCKGWFWFIGDVEKVPRFYRRSANVRAFFR
ncbi:hypothetical protein [Celeribacter sp.]|uniref:hypothetical protein n=1 Tax=Celeribacter sp. TaxID=1890673 RepID=UPI003A91C52D